MDKKFTQKIVAVVLGLSLFIAVISTFSLLFDSILADDIIKLTSVSEKTEKIIGYMKYSAIGILCVSVAAITCYCFTYFSKNKKVFGIISTVLALFMSVTCIALTFDLRGTVLDGMSSSAYEAATGYFQELLQIAIAHIIACAYFAVITAFAFKKKTAGKSEKTETEEVKVNEEI